MSMSTAVAPVAAHSLTLRQLRPFYGRRPAVHAVDLNLPANQITAIIGPSGCGKSTVLRCLNRMHEAIEGARVEGTVLLDDEDLYQPDLDPTLVRRKVGMVFQQPVVLRTRTIYENVAVGLRLAGVTARSELDATIEGALRAAALWDEVKEKLQMPATALSGGQQQRLSIARTIAVKPAVILFDEPCSALDPIATLKIEELLLELRQTFTIVIVTHNMQQAARISDQTAVFMVDQSGAPTGVLVEFDRTAQIFSQPGDSRTEDYISGRVG
jgi:phosphate transport system ATP-binding protein